MTNAFYGGGHQSRSASDFFYWCLKYTTVYGRSDETFVVPKIPLGLASPYYRLANCAEMTGIEIPVQYRDLWQLCSDEGTFISPAEAMRLRGAILFSNGFIYVSAGDGRRIVFEQNYMLVLKFLTEDQSPNATFEYGAKLPGLDYF